MVFNIIISIIKLLVNLFIIGFNLFFSFFAKKCLFKGAGLFFKKFFKLFFEIIIILYIYFILSIINFIGVTFQFINYIINKKIFYIGIISFIPMYLFFFLSHFSLFVFFFNLKIRFLNIKKNILRSLPGFFIIIKKPGKLLSIFFKNLQIYKLVNFLTNLIIVIFVYIKISYIYFVKYNLSYKIFITFIYCFIKLYKYIYNIIYLFFIINFFKLIKFIINFINLSINFLLKFYFNVLHFFINIFFSIPIFIYFFSKINLEYFIKYNLIKYLKYSLIFFNFHFFKFKLTFAFLYLYLFNFIKLYVKQIFYFCKKSVKWFYIIYIYKLKIYFKLNFYKNKIIKYKYKFIYMYKFIIKNMYGFSFFIKALKNIFLTLYYTILHIRYIYLYTFVDITLFLAYHGQIVNQYQCYLINKIFIIIKILLNKCVLFFSLFFIYFIILKNIIKYIFIQLFLHINIIYNYIYIKIKQKFIYIAQNIYIRLSYSIRQKMMLFMSPRQQYHFHGYPILRRAARRVRIIRRYFRLQSRYLAWNIVNHIYSIIGLIIRKLIFFTILAPIKFFEIVFSFNFNYCLYIVIQFLKIICLFIIYNLYKLLYLYMLFNLPCKLYKQILFQSRLLINFLINSIFFLLKVFNFCLIKLIIYMYITTNNLILLINYLINIFIYLLQFSLLIINYLINIIFLLGNITFILIQYCLLELFIILNKIIIIIKNIIINIFNILYKICYNIIIFFIIYPTYVLYTIIYNLLYINIKLTIILLKQVIAIYKIILYLIITYSVIPIKHILKLIQQPISLFYTYNIDFEIDAYILDCLKFWYNISYALTGIAYYGTLVLGEESIIFIKKYKRKIIKILLLLLLIYIYSNEHNINELYYCMTLTPDALKDYIIDLIINYSYNLKDFFYLVIEYTKNLLNYLASNPISIYDILDYIINMIYTIIEYVYNLIFNLIIEIYNSIINCIKEINAEITKLISFLSHHKVFSKYYNYCDNYILTPFINYLINPLINYLENNYNILINLLTLNINNIFIFINEQWFFFYNYLLKILEIYPIFTIHYYLQVYISYSLDYILNIYNLFKLTYYCLLFDTKNYMYFIFSDVELKKTLIIYFIDILLKINTYILDIILYMQDYNISFIKTYLNNILSIFNTNYYKIIKIILYLQY